MSESMSECMSEEMQAAKVGYALHIVTVKPQPPVSWPKCDGMSSCKRLLVELLGLLSSQDVDNFQLVLDDAHATVTVASLVDLL